MTDHTQPKSARSILSKVSPLILPYIDSLQNHSLHLLTEVVGSSSSWLVQCYIASLFSQSNATIVLVSWLHNYEFWRKELRRSFGLDLTEFVNKGKLLYVEGLTTNHQIPGGTTDYENGLQGISGTISKLLASALPEGETILILDFPDIPLTMEPTSSDILLTHIAQWRQQAYATIVTLTIENLASASYEGHPHNAALGGASPVLLQQQQFVLSIAHHADMVFSTKLLDTGTAKDISGVVRITPRTGAMGDKELLYFVELGVGKGVEVWERGGLRG